MSKRTSSTPSTRNKKRARVVTDQAVLDTYFRNPIRPPSPTKGQHTATNTRRAQLGNHDQRSAVISDEQSTSLVSGEEPYRPELFQGEHHWHHHGTQARPIQLDSDEDYHPKAEGTAGQESIAGPSHLSPLAPSLPPSEVHSHLSVKGHNDFPKFGPSALGSTGHSPPVDYSSVAVDPLVYPIDICPWRLGSPAPYSFLVNAFVALAETRSRIAILNALTNTLRCFLLYDPTSLLPALYLLSNSLSPPYSPIELGIGVSVISKAIQHVSGLTPSALRKLYNSSGDPGDVAFEAKSNVRTLVPHPPLHIKVVYESLLKIANLKGQGAARQKQSIVERLLVSATGEETRYLVRTLSLNLRVGAVRTSMLTALARALVLTPPSNPSLPRQVESLYYATPHPTPSAKSLRSDTKKRTADPQRDELLVKFARAEALVKQVYVQHPNYDHIVEGILEGDLDGLSKRVPLTVGIPLHPTLGSPTRSLDEIYDRLGELQFAAEFKYDGQRAQIHASRVGGDNPQVHIFSRHLENMTTKYPDVVSLVRCMFERASNLQSFIIDSEVVAIDPTDGGLRSFQELSNRAKKDVEIKGIKVPVCAFAFDLMYLDGEALLERPFRERRALLRTRFPILAPEEPGIARFDHVESCESEQGREYIEEFWQKAVESRCEGLMVKLLDNGQIQEDVPHQKCKSRNKHLPATYEPDKRTCAWLKLKKDYVEGLGDTLDLVPVGAWHGNGRKAGWWSPLLLAVWDPAKEKLVAVCKCMSDLGVTKFSTGFSDAFYKDLSSRYAEDSDNCSRQPLWECETGGFKPDVYFRPHEVWEIRGADVTLSPVSLAALGEVSATRGMSLRFPRFVRVREDKDREQASTPQFLARMYRDEQSRGKDMTGVDDGDLVDMELEADEQIEEDSGD
ncbi:hypothetical protein PAXRUDRAFT_794423 [Paxillus rubicundulus Ve08.2h10]|uniref:DNA ligase n=1 Tax=Paxillus rubicundulus Ve08.2h10 TaxID=930991 RepID=A0A0D0ECB1_9AGAM|nr:hypothetical protein PAXRUDRAFT_794423 [Paxillus rubicundulus Ve08.2h10]